MPEWIDGNNFIVMSMLGHKTLYNILQKKNNRPPTREEFKKACRFVIEKASVLNATDYATMYSRIEMHLIRDDRERRKAMEKKETEERAERMFKRIENERAVQANTNITDTMGGAQNG